jgi:C4-type Zn-finger protein
MNTVYTTVLGKRGLFVLRGTSENEVLINTREILGTRECPICDKNTLKLTGYEVDGAGIIIDMTMSFECVYKPCEAYKTNAFKWG